MVRWKPGTAIIATTNLENLAEMDVGSILDGIQSKMHFLKLILLSPQMSKLESDGKSTSMSLGRQRGVNSEFHIQWHSPSCKSRKGLGTEKDNGHAQLLQIRDIIRCFKGHLAIELMSKEAL